MERGVRSAVRLLHRLNTVMDGAARIIGFAVRSRLLRVARKTRIDGSYETLLFVDGFDNARCRASDSSTSFLLEFRDGSINVCHDGQTFLRKSFSPMGNFISCAAWRPLLRRNLLVGSKEIRTMREISENEGNLLLRTR